MIGFTGCCHHRGRVKFVSAQLPSGAGATERAGVGARGSVLHGAGAPHLGREGELPQR